MPHPSDEHVAVAHDGNVWRRSHAYGEIRIGHVQKVSKAANPEKYVAMTPHGVTQHTALRRDAVAWLVAQHGLHLHSETGKLEPQEGPEILA